MTASSLEHYLALMTSSVSPSIASQPIIGIPSLLHRYGSRGRHRVVCRSFPPNPRPHTRWSLVSHPIPRCSHPSEITPKGRKSTKLAQTLLNGNNICMVSPFFSSSNVALWMVSTDNPNHLFSAFSVGAWERWARTGIVRRVCT